jgi:hypothetical protein
MVGRVLQGAEVERLMKIVAKTTVEGVRWRVLTNIG